MDPHAQDHRAIGQRLDLFHQQDESPGAVFWHPRGLVLFRIVEDYVRRRMRAAGFREIRTPQMLARRLWETSGHWDKYRDNMFTLTQGGDGEDRVYALKPMSCPGHVEIYRARLWSYRDLPSRFAEFGAVHRNEASGALSGLMRLRAFTQDDAHIFCRPDQVIEEVAKFAKLQSSIYSDFGFDRVVIGFSTRPAVRAGSDEVWDRAEAALAAAVQAAGLVCRPQPGDGAFYGPKLDFTLTDNRGREWQCGTIQCDLVLPERFDISYIGAQSQRERPIMLHHAVLGSLERFIAVLLEHHGARLPLWLAPEQMVVANIVGAAADYARRCADELEAEGFRVITDLRDERIARKAADARNSGIPVFIAVGKTEQDSGTISVRHGDGRPQAMAVSAVVDQFKTAAFR
jgi:threonyl-tRNA synthetase